MQKPLFEVQKSTGKPHGLPGTIHAVPFHLDVFDLFGSLLHSFFHLRSREIIEKKRCMYKMILETMMAEHAYVCTMYLYYIQPKIDVRKE